MRSDNKNKFAKGQIADFDSTKGYFIGRFMGEKGFPNLETDEVEIAWKKIPMTLDEPRAHYHKVGVEINIVISGGYTAEVNGEIVDLKRGDFLVVYPESPLRNIKAEDGTELIVVKAPSVSQDKFDVEQ